MTRSEAASVASSTAGTRCSISVQPYRFGDGDRHRIGIRLENALDEDYASSLGRSFMDVDGSSYPYANLGTPRTFHVAYAYRL